MLDGLTSPSSFDAREMLLVVERIFYKRRKGKGGGGSPGRWEKVAPCLSEFQEVEN